MAKARALYVCPATQGAITSVAPVVVDNADYVVTRVLLMQGVENPARPTATEDTDAIRSKKGIERFLASRGVPMQTVQAPPGSERLWREKIAGAISADLLGDIDMVILNAQGGTKQMSFGAWDGIAQAIPPRPQPNLPVRRCFVRSADSLEVQIGDDVKMVTGLSLTDFLTIYGFEEVNQPQRLARERWMLSNSGELLKLWKFSWGLSKERAKETASRLALTDDAPWSKAKLSESAWLEAGIYLRARERVNGPDFAAAGLEIWDWAATGTGPTSSPEYGVDKHYELDVAVARSGVLHLLECKASEKLSPDMIHKQGALRTRLQGRAGVNAIVALRIPRPDTVLDVKARHLNVQFVLATQNDVALCLNKITGAVVET